MRVFQIYMDFRVLTALDGARLFNIQLTQNFNNPYIAINNRFLEKVAHHAPMDLATSSIAATMAQLENLEHTRCIDGHISDIGDLAWCKLDRDLGHPWFMHGMFGALQASPKTPQTLRLERRVSCGRQIVATFK
jgi:hypothetical protein